MEVFIYSMRMIMLISSLKLIGHRYLDPIFVSLCGLIQGVSVLFKAMKGKKKFYKLSAKDVEKEGNTTVILSQNEMENKIEKQL